MNNLVIKTNATVAGVPATIVNSKATYINGQVVNQQITLSANSSFASPVGFTAFTMTTSVPVQFICARGTDSNYINQTVNQVITIDDTVDSFTLLNTGTTVATLNLTFTVNAGSAPPQQSLVTSVNNQTGAVTIHPGPGIAIDNTTAPITISVLPPSSGNVGAVKAGAGIQIEPDGTLSATNAGAVKSVSLQVPDSNGNVSIAASDISAASGASLIVGDGSTTGNIQLRRIVAGAGITVQTDPNNNLQVNVSSLIPRSVNNRSPNPSTGNIALQFSDLTNIPNFVQTINGIGPDVNGNSTVKLPALTFEFGNGGQPNGGFGLDKGTYWQADANSQGWFSYNDLTFTANPDGTFVLPSGTYLVSINIKVQPSTGGADTYQLPVQMYVSCTNLTAYGWPGIYQNALQIPPSYPTSTTATDGRILASITGSQVMSFDGSSGAILGYTKVVGSANNIVLRAQGFASFVKIG